MYFLADVLVSLFFVWLFITIHQLFVNGIYPLQAKVRDWRDYESDLNHYCLGDLWESFREWSVHGVGVPLLFKGKGSVTEEFIPYLSGIQLYVDSRKFSSTFR